MNDNEQTEPNFIGIGVQKGGTSWLHKQLVAHPQVFIPENRKEIHFFDEYYERGLDWYKNFFKNAGENQKAIGEITPNYIYDDYSAPRIKNHFPDMRFIVILRDPVARAYSHYQMTFQSGEGQKYSSFDDFMTNHPHAFKRGLYTQQIEKWLKLFDQKQFLFAWSEQIFENEKSIQNFFRQLGNFLDIDSDLFNMKIAMRRVGGARGQPKFTSLASMAQKTRLFLRDHDMDFIADGLKKIGITRQIFGTKQSMIKPLSDEQKNKWEEAYAEDQKKLTGYLTLPPKIIQR